MKLHIRGIALLALLSTVLLLGVACDRTRSTGTVIDDATITANVKSALIKAPNVDALAIDVDTLSGVVTLSGKVKTPEEANRARDVARAVEGVKDVKTTLQVQPAN
jgi:hyperosmotically inducible protein